LALFHRVAASLTGVQAISSSANGGWGIIVIFHLGIAERKERTVLRLRMACTTGRQP
jgi:hypothetical protein